MDARSGIPVDGFPLGKTRVIVTQTGVETLSCEFEILRLTRYAIHECRPGSLHPVVFRIHAFPALVLFQ